jgi:hypothetical protein
MEPESIPITENSQAVQAHLTIIQSVIQRMATNSSSCKAWCITLVSAILVVVADKAKPQFLPIALIPTVLFFVLDTYYLALESMFRHSYNLFIDKLHSGKLVSSDLYVVTPKGNFTGAFALSLCSFSIWPFYLVLIFMIYLAKLFVV